MALDHPLNDRDRRRLHEPPARYAAMPFQQFKEQAAFERFDARAYREDGWEQSLDCFRWKSGVEMQTWANAWLQLSCSSCEGAPRLVVGDFLVYPWPRSRRRRIHTRYRQ